MTYSVYIITTGASLQLWQPCSGGSIVQLIASASAQPLGPKPMLLLPTMAPQMRAAVALQSYIRSNVYSPKYACMRVLCMHVCRLGARRQCQCRAPLLYNCCRLRTGLRKQGLHV